MNNVYAKAIIKVLEGRFKNGQLENNELEVQFNPGEYGLEISNSFQETALPGLQNPIVQFVNGNLRTLSMDLLFDTWTDHNGTDVTIETDRFADILSIDADVHAPPRVEFKWGRLTFKAIIESWSQRFTMFNSAGLPVRATVSVSFKQYRPISEQMQDPRHNSVDKTKRRVLTADDNIWSVAAQEYGHPREWRRIAKHNRIENPGSSVPGDILVLPPAESL